MQYLIKAKEFMGMNFYVDEDVLVPRSDTEILVEEAIKILKQRKNVKILELCTGSGIIAVSLEKELKNADITAIDISKNALEIAKKNESKLIREGKIKFIQSDMFENVQGKFDVIIVNPPYIKTDVIKKYNLKFEPQIALDGGEDGLEFYRIILKQGYEYLKKNGIMLLEIGYDQKEEVTNLAKEINRYKNIECIQDLGGNDRVVKITL